MRIFILSILFILSACSPNLPQKKFPSKEKASNISIEKVKELASGNNSCAWSVYKKLTDKEQNKNIFFSPYSISTVLAMLYAGAKNDTATQMQQALHFPKADLHSTFSALIDHIQKQTPGCKVHTSNALWGQKESQILPEFLNTTGKNYGAGLYQIDFTKPEEARKTINQWVEYNTERLIKELLVKGTIEADTKLILTNTIYFKGQWLHPFLQMDTSQRDFHLSKTEKIQVPIMSHYDKSFRHYQEDGFQVLELPYKGKTMAMSIFLPDDIDGLEKLEQQLTVEKMTSIAKQMTEKDCFLMLPKFKATLQFEVKEILTSLGMKDAFIANRADFSGINGKKNLFVDKVVHKAFVNVDEKGTEAAAATAGIARATSARQVAAKFIADHPFFFTISNLETGNILFMGRILDPR